MHKLKKFFKVIFIILIICLLGFGVYRYQKLKKEGKLDQVFSSTKNSSISEESLSTGSNHGANSSETSSEENSSGSGSSEGGYVVEDKNYDDYYNQFNFDNTLLLYEGKQHNQAVKEALDILIKDADDPLYTKPTVVFENFSGLSTNEITANDLQEYKAVLQAAKNQVGGSSCTFTFGYSNLKTHVNKITITKN